MLTIFIGGKTSVNTSAGSDPVNTIVTQASSSSRQESSDRTVSTTRPEQRRQKRMNFSLKLGNFTGSNIKNWLGSAVAQW